MKMLRNDSHRFKALLVSSLVLFLWMPAAAGAEDDDGVRVFLIFSGSDKDAKALEQSAPRFRSVVLKEGLVKFAGSKEMEAVYSQCNSEVGVGATSERECQLRAANRIAIDQLLELSAMESGKNAFDLQLQVWAPDSNELVFEIVVESEGKSLKVAAKEGFPKLAAAYLCWSGVGSACNGPSDLGNGTGRLEILDVTPSPVTVLLDGTELGLAPNQFLDLPAGPAELTLKLPGYSPYVVAVDLSATTTTLSGIVLAPLPAVLSIQCNVAAAEVVVNGEVRGTCSKDAAASLEVESGAVLVEVRSAGFSTFSERLELMPGARSTLEADLKDVSELEKACEAGDPARCWEACESGHMPSCTTLGFMYSNGDGVPLDDDKAFTLYTMACNGNSSAGCYNLAFLYKKGRGATKNATKARSLYQAACDDGLMTACRSLGFMLQKGEGGSEDNEGAAALYKTACDGGEAAACNNLGYLYREGLGVKEDIGEAAVLYEQSCGANLQAACNNLAFLYQQGQGVGVDYKKARTLYQGACDDGVMAACSSLAFMHKNAQGGSEDTDAAKKLFKKACDGGYVKACSY